MSPLPSTDSSFNSTISLFYQFLSPRGTRSPIDHPYVKAFHKLKTDPFRLGTIISRLQDFHGTKDINSSINWSSKQWWHLAMVAASLFDRAKRIRTFNMRHTKCAIHLKVLWDATSGVGLMSIRSIWTCSKIFVEIIGFSRPFDLLRAFLWQNWKSLVRKTIFSRVTP